MTLDDVLYISYAVPAIKLRELVPEPLQLATLGKDIAFISIVILRSTRVRLKILPLIQFNYNQLNIRTYVIDPISGQQAVYFLRSGVTSSVISFMTRMSGIPWQLVNLDIEANPYQETGSYLARGNWYGDYYLNCQLLGEDTKEILWFENRKKAVDFLIRPLIGFIGDNRRLGRFEIRHPEVEPQLWQLTEFDFPLFKNLGVVNELDNPHSIFFLPTADFSIYLPPRKI
jgi:hypothetical protein